MAEEEDREEDDLGDSELRVEGAVWNEDGGELARAINREWRENQEGKESLERGSRGSAPVKGPTYIHPFTALCSLRLLLQSQDELDTMSHACTESERHLECAWVVVR